MLSNASVSISHAAVWECQFSRVAPYPTKSIALLLRKLAMGPTIADITFIQVLKESDSSTTFKVTIQGKLCVLKVVCCY